MSIQVGANYSGYTNGYKAVEIENIKEDEILHTGKIKKDQEAIKPEIEAWEKRCDELRGGRSREGVVYEKSSQSIDNSTYSINKMSQKDRTAIVEQMKTASQQREKQMLDLVQKTLSGQVSAFGKATGNDIWKTLASGNFTVDAATKSQAQKDIGEDGYWGVKQTSQRLFDFASALAGDDVEKMKKMQDAMEKGFKQATKAWGKTLPDISKKTYDAVLDKFDQWVNGED